MIRNIWLTLLAILVTEKVQKIDGLKSETLGVRVHVFEFCQCEFLCPSCYSLVKLINGHFSHCTLIGCTGLMLINLVNYV